MNEFFVICELVLLGRVVFLILPCELVVERSASVLAVQPCFFSQGVLLALLALVQVVQVVQVLLLVLLLLVLLVLTLVGS